MMQWLLTPGVGARTGKGGNDCIPGGQRAQAQRWGKGILPGRIFCFKYLISNILKIMPPLQFQRNLPVFGGARPPDANLSGFVLVHSIAKAYFQAELVPKLFTFPFQQFRNNPDAFSDTGRQRGNVSVTAEEVL
jgi:hypothetical protein